ncbi:MAG: ABC transporter permease [Candidatus Babeliaceae bacterium]
MNKLVSQYSAFFVGIPAIIWQILFLYLPLFFMVFLSFLKVSEHNIVEGFTLNNYYLFFSKTYALVFFRSLGLAFFTAFSCFILAYPLAYYLAFARKFIQTVLLFLLVVPFWTNFLLHIFAWFFVLERGGFLNNMLLFLGIIHEPFYFLNSFFAIALMMIYYYLPFMVFPLYAALERFDRKLIEASLDLGATWFQTLFRIMIPLTMPGIKTGFFLVFVPAFAEFVIPELMGGDKTMFAGSVISYYILGSQTISLGAAFTLLSVLVLIASVFIIYSILRRSIQMIK